MINIRVDYVRKMLFASEHDAYVWYFAYAKCHGFDIRKNEVAYGKRRNKVMCQFVCNKKIIKKFI